MLQCAIWSNCLAFKKNPQHSSTPSIMLLTHSPHRSKGIEREGRQKQKDPYGKSIISQDKSPLLNSCHDSLDNNLHHPAHKTHLKACTIPLPSDFSGWKCVTAYKPLHCPATLWMLPNVSVLDYFASLEQGLENIWMRPISMWNTQKTTTLSMSLPSHLVG